ncbi:hypothetical protein SAMN04487996_111255 [Dyadobacter soli]|uniref:Ketoreductase domain-containing protein n=1 Tax=Dyadobacter soli TaxID=659014 RepID=A0A1G7MG38_9BACT|nr:hypothetical protein SAMN04487996_111255 [Dyadobacter soli]
MESNIKNKVVVITGASSGLGEATARHLAEQGAMLVLGARRTNLLENIVKEIVSNGGSAIYQAVDVTRKTDVQALIDAALHTYGKVDVLINNAGIMPIAPMTELRTDEWDDMIDINLRGVLYGIAAVLPVFQKQKSGHIINLGSVAGIKVFSPGGTVYSGTKFALRAISEGLRHELDATIRTTIIAPGAVESELKHGTSHAESSVNVKKFYKMAIPASSVARAIAFAIEQPADVDINEIVIRPTAQEF